MNVDINPDLEQSELEKVLVKAPLEQLQTDFSALASSDLEQDIDEGCQINSPIADARHQLLTMWGTS